VEEEGEDKKVNVPETDYVHVLCVHVPEMYGTPSNEKCGVCPCVCNNSVASSSFNLFVYLKLNGVLVSFTMRIGMSNDVESYSGPVPLNDIRLYVADDTFSDDEITLSSVTSTLPTTAANATSEPNAANKCDIV
jgi:hypothetical protein